MYLTFDDGPSPEITDWVLDELAKYGAKASFFLIGENTQRFPKLVHRIIDEGHSLGNHTHTHKNGWKTDNGVYLNDFLKAQRTMMEYTGYNTRLFRPPYGKIRKAQARQIKLSHQIVMMDVISGDFDPKVSGETCVRHVVKNVKNGSIVLMHDSLKAKENLSYALPIILKHLSERGYQFKAIEEARAKGAKIHLGS